MKQNYISRWVGSICASLLLLPAVSAGASGGLATAHGGRMDSPSADQALRCDFAGRSGRAFQFSTADSSLHDYGFVLWKAAPTLAAEPLDYARYHGRHGKLTGRTLMHEGLRWFEGILDDCSPVYAEDASAHSEYIGVDHLDLHGKIVFADTRAKAEGLIGQTIYVRADGLEPGQRLYTPDQQRSYALQDGQPLKVVGVDTHRYAFAKGVGPLFLQVQTQSGERGLIKFNPRYMAVAQGDFPLQPRSRAQTQMAALAGGQAQAAAPQKGKDYVLTVSNFSDESAGLAAERALKRDGFNANLLAQPGENGTVYKLQIGGFPTLDMAAAMAGILARRFGWVSPRADLPATP